MFKNVLTQVFIFDILLNVAEKKEMQNLTCQIKVKSSKKALTYLWQFDILDML